MRKSIFLPLLSFEVKDRLLRLSSIIYFLVYFALSFLLGISFAGAFKGASVSFGLSNKLALNSPVVLNFLISLIGYMGLLVTAPIFGQSINKDFENKFSQILFATPLQKRAYFFVRFIGSVISSVVILSSIGFGLWFATFMSFLDPTLIGPNHFYFYLMPYLTNLIPNTIFFGAVFIAVVSFTKKMAPVYIASVAVFTGYLISSRITSDMDNKFVAAMIEPFGLEATSQLIRYWSVAEQSTHVIPLTGYLLYNRLIWAAFGLICFVFAYSVFSPFKLPKEKAKAAQKPEFVSSFGNIEKEIPAVSLNFHSVKVFLGLAKSEFKQAFTHIYFLMILLCGMLYIFAISSQVGKIYGTETLPVTYQTLEVISQTFGLFVVILTTFYAGELVWKEREQHFYELVDSKPVSNFNLYLSKLLALIAIQIFLSIVIMLCCVTIQVCKGYTHFEWSIYVERLFVYSLSARILVSVLALFLQTLAPNKYVGHSLVIAYYMCVWWLPSFGLDHTLYLIGQVPVTEFSDMNRFGTSAKKAIPVGLYWAFFHLGLATLTVLFWRRGVMQSFPHRFSEAKRRFTRPYRLLVTSSAFGFGCLGAFIFYNTNILNHYYSKSELELQQVDYEKNYKKFEKMPTLELVKVHIEANIHPEIQVLKASGVLTYVNKSTAPITQLLLNYDRNLKKLVLNWSRPVKRIEDNARLNTKVFEFVPPLAPNETVTLNFSDSIEPAGFKNGEFYKKVVQNGTFLNGTDFTPITGYLRSSEISQEKTRRKYHLPERPRIADVNDKDALNHTYVSNEASWIDFDAIVSTSADQIAIAPGYLVKEWRVNGQRFFHYQMDKPILNFYSILSARYEVTRDELNGIKIEVYHHPGHTTDIPRMINSVKKSIDYYSKNFSPYQYRQFRIIEFPRYELFAQAFPNTIPFSEGIGFIAKVDAKDPESVDYPFYITSHETAHQWWGHQVIGGNVQGATMLSESLAQYSSLMVQEKEYGPKQMKKFLKYELDRYLYGRSSEPKKELPLELNENQPYIHYQKGSLVFYALKDYLGEDVVNQVLKDFLRDYAFKGPPFPRAVDLVERFKKVTPADKQYLIKDLFETITFYDNRADSVTYQKVGNQYKVTIKEFSKKVRTDDQGQETEIPMNDYVDVGLEDKDGTPFYLEKHLLHSGENTIEVTVDQLPVKGGIDPINKLIDRVPEDNVVNAKEAKAI